VKDELFGGEDFFDPHDRVQVKYEMVRRVQKDNWTVSQAAQAYGFSRPSFYQTQQAVQEQGLAALVPRKRGPKGAHKLSEPVMEFLRQHKSADKTLRAGALASLVEQHHGVRVHPRTIERALQRAEKKRHSNEQQELCGMRS